MVSSLQQSLLEQQLRPQYAAVLSALFRWQEQRPGAYVNMPEIAKLAWPPERRPQDPKQIKTNVQRAIYEIRMKLGKDLILNDGSTYKLNPHRLGTPNIASDVSARPTLLQSSFESQVKKLLEDAKVSRTQSYSLFWGDRAARALRDEFDESLFQTVSSARRVRVVCSEGLIAVDILASLIWQFNDSLSAFCDQFHGWLELIVMASPLGVGLARIEQREEDSRLQLANRTGPITATMDGSAVNAYLQPLDERIALCRKRAAYRPVLFIDPFDKTLDSQGRQLWKYFETLVDKAADTDPASIFVADTLPTFNREAQ